MSAPEASAWLSGEFVPEARARVPATSPSLLLGVGAFETMRLVRGSAPLLALHLARLQSACARLGLPLPDAAWSEIVQELGCRNALSEGVVRLTLAHDFAFATCRPLPAELEDERRNGVALPLRPLQRALRDVKSTARLDLWLAEQAAGGEVALLGADDALYETSRSNVFALTPAGLETAEPPDTLPGIARALVLDSARELGLGVHRRAPQLAECEHWLELFVTNAVRGVRGVRALGEQSLPAPVPGPFTQRLQSALDAHFGL